VNGNLHYIVHRDTNTMEDSLIIVVDALDDAVHEVQLDITNTPDAAFIDDSTETASYSTSMKNLLVIFNIGVGDRDGLVAPIELDPNGSCLSIQPSGTGLNSAGLYHVPVTEDPTQVGAHLFPLFAVQICRIPCTI